MSDHECCIWCDMEKCIKCSQERYCKDCQERKNRFEEFSSVSGHIECKRCEYCYIERRKCRHCEDMMCPNCEKLPKTICTDCENLHIRFEECEYKTGCFSDRGYQKTTVYKCENCHRIVCRNCKDDDIVEYIMCWDCSRPESASHHKRHPR